MVKESQLGTFQFRIQLTTSANKCDVYLVMLTGLPLIVKGPYKDDTIPKRYIELQNMKDKYGMPHVTSRVVYLIPDRWSEGVPLGLRNKCDRTKPHAFLVTESLIPMEQYVRRIHSSKVWPPTEVIDPDKTPLHLSELSNLNERELLDYYQALAFRVKYGLSDLADRNFLFVNGRVYSIDEESTKTEPLDLLAELKKKKYEFLKSQWPKYRDLMHPELKEHLDSLTK